MCGITGFFDNELGGQSISVLKNMLKVITYRGPDDEGVWNEKGAYLGHRRLSILDLSSSGHQPMLSACGRFVIAFNGEIYNFRQIRQELEKNQSIEWRGHSDTEVMLAAISTWGFEQAIQLFNGMFAFALWDRELQQLVLARDRFGEKPLYYQVGDQRIIFGSELKSLEQFPSFEKEIDRDALCEYFRYKYIPAPWTIYKNTKKLKPAHYLIWSPQSGIIQERCYWDVKAIAESSQKKTLDISDADAILQLDTLLRDSVALRMESDVPLGAFLSGGIDSSVVVALMQAQSTSPIKTFSIGFDIEGFNEAEHAKAVAQHLGTEHTEQYVTGKDALAVVPLMGQLYDEPFADASQIPTFLVSQIAKRHVTVCLSGDGGDEVFGGYSRYLRNADIWTKLSKIPSRKVIGYSIEKAPLSLLNTLAFFFNKALNRKTLLLTGRKLKLMAPLLSARNQYALYCLLMMSWMNPQEIVLNSQDIYHKISQLDFDLDDLIHIMMMHDTLTYMPGDILTKVDRATMAVSLEGRIPLLDHRIAEFAWRLPLSQKVRNKQGKWMLREVLYQYVPRELIDRPKMGFGVPLGEWLRTELREWVESLIQIDKLRQQNLLNADIVHQQWHHHLQRYGDYSSQLWPVIMLQAWLEVRGL